MAKFRRSNPLALAVLGLLQERPMHPYEMASTLRARAKEESIKINYGSLYTVVEVLHRHRLIVPRETVREGRRPERTIYEITDAGVAEFVDWLSHMLSTPEKEFTQFEAALSLMPGLPPDEVVPLLRQRAMRLELELVSIRAVLERAGAQVPRLFLIEGEYRAILREAELGFVRSLADDIESGSFAAVKTWRRIHEMRQAGAPEEEIRAELERVAEGGDVD